MSVTPQNLHQAILMKVLLLGESNVGKTSLVTRYSADKFDAQNNLLTVGIDIRKIKKEVNGKHILLELWDTAGQEKYKTIPTQYFRGVQGILLVYDITDAETFTRIKDWLDKVEENSDATKIIMYLVGNKLDMNQYRQVKTLQAQKFANSRGMGFAETSAKQATNVELMFNETISSIISKGIKCPSKHIRLEEDQRTKEPQKESSCCG